MLDFMLIDAFADAAFTGNPAAVVRGMFDDALMQKIAMEFNQAETAFVKRQDDGRFAIRWFTPKAEVPLCGHATLAAARALFDWGDATGDRISFVTRESVELHCDRNPDGSLTLDFPATPPYLQVAPTNVARALGIGGPVAYIGSTTMNLMLKLDSEEQVRAVNPDLRALATWHPVGVIVTAKSSGKFDFVSRFFAPAVGIDEDPATGSAHCALATFWADRLGTTKMTARQLSPRGATFDLELIGNRVRLGGGTVVTAKGTLEGVTP